MRRTHPMRTLDMKPDLTEANHGVSIQDRTLRRTPQGRRGGSERGVALVVVVVFTFMSVASVAFFLSRTSQELGDSRMKSASVKNLFYGHSALSRAHATINQSMDSAESAALNLNAALADPEVVDGVSFIEGTNRSVRVRTEKPSDRFDANGDELPPLDDFGSPTAYEDLPWAWYVLEARVHEPMYTMADGQGLGAMKVIRQYVRDGTPLSNNFLAVIDDDLGLGGSAVNPGKPAEGEVQTNKHLYIMTSNPYYANRLLAVDGVSYIAGATEDATVYLHPENNFEAEPLYLPLPDSLTSNPSDPDETLKKYAQGSSPTSVGLTTGNPDFTVTMGGVGAASSLKLNGTDPTPIVEINYDAYGDAHGIHVEGNVNADVTFQGDTMTLRLRHATNSGKWIQVAGLPTPDNGVVFLDTRVDIGGISRRTTLKGEVSNRVTMATTGNVDIVDSIRYVDDDGDYATKMAYASDLEGVAPADMGNVPEIPASTSVSTTAEISYSANKRPPGVVAVSGDGFYDGSAVLGVVSSQDIVISSSVPENAEMAGAYLSLEKRLTLEGMGYNSSGQLTSINGSNPFYTVNGARSSIRRFGGLISYKRPATAVVNGSGGFLYGFKRGFSLFDEDMKQQPPPFFPKDKRPQYLGWELIDLGVKPIN